MLLALFNWIGSRVGLGAAYKVLGLGVALLVGAAGGGWVAWHLGRGALGAENAALRISYAEASRMAAKADAQRLQDAQARSDALAQQLQQMQASNHQILKEKNHALSRVATGRVCLSGPVLGVLGGSPGLRLAGAQHLPEAGAGAAAAHAPAAAHTNAASAPPGAGGRDLAAIEATDADVAGWAIEAGAQYEQCRQRLNALIDWHAAPTAQGSHER